MSLTLTEVAHARKVIREQGLGVVRLVAGKDALAAFFVVNGWVPPANITSVETVLGMPVTHSEYPMEWAYVRDGS